MTSQNRSTSVRTRLAFTALAGVAGCMLMTGCGLGTSAVSSGNLTGAAISGKLTGGPNPIVGATVKLFTTGDANGRNAGYGVGNFRQEAIQTGANPGQETKADGTFSFGGGYSCPAGQYLYIVSAGGDSGSGFNPKIFLVAALGRCDDLFVNGVYSGGFIYLNELTTVAAGYALGNFTSFSFMNIFTAVGIGAPATNNAATGCVANGTTCPTTSAAGLGHAFQNAINLVNPFSGRANTTVPGSLSSQVPTQLLDSIANSLVACVNSNGSGPACQTIFTATGVNFADGNIAEVAVNLAKNPTLAGSGITPAQFYGAATPQTSFYQPMLSSAPADYSVAITIPKLTGAGPGTQGLTSPASGTLDINDNYYVGNYDSAAHLSSNALSFNSRAVFVSSTPDDLIDPTGNGASTDSLGNLYLVGSNTVSSASAVSRFSVSNATGVIAPGMTTFFPNDPTPLTASAVDRSNNLWIGSFGGNLSEVVAPGTVPAGPVNNINVRLLSGTVGAIAVDPNQNIWATTFTNDANNAVTVLENVGTLAAPAYAQSAVVKAYDFQGSFASGISFVAASPYNAYVANLSNTPGLTLFNATVSGARVTNVTNSGTHITAGTTSTSNNETDGNGIIFAADGAHVVKYTPGATAAISLTPCILPPVPTNAACLPNPYSGVQSLSIDSAGSVWFSAVGSGTVSEMIGAAAPAWPLLPLGILGKP